MQAETFTVPIDAYAMHLRPSELAAVAASLGADKKRLVPAVRALPVNDRAPLWELAMRHYARRRPLDQAAGEIGMDLIRARTLIETFSQAVAGER